MEFKERLRDLRLKKHMKSKEVAQLAGVSDHTYISYENRGSQPPYDVLIKLSKVFGVTTDFLLGVDQDVYGPIIESGFAITDIFVENGHRYLRVENPQIEVGESTPPEEYILTQGQAMAICEAFNAIKRNVCNMESMRKALSAFLIDDFEVLD